MAVKDVNLYWLRPGEFAAYRGHTLLLTDDSGLIQQGVEGLWLYRTRFISRLKLTVEGKPPKLVSANPVEPHLLLSYHLAPSPAGRAAAPTPEGDKPGGELASEAIELQVADFVGGGLHRDLHVTNHGMAPARISLVIEIDADFSDYAEAQTGERKQNAEIERIWGPGDDGGTLRLRYCHPQLPHATEARFSGLPVRWDGKAVIAAITLTPREVRTLTLDVSPVFRGEKFQPIYGTDGTVIDQVAERTEREWVDGCARLETLNPRVKEAWDRAVSDIGSLQLLDGEGAERFTPAAGIPGYLGLFGRDVLVTALQSAHVNPDTQTGSISLVGHWTATEYNTRYDAEPGRVLHQRLLGPLALLGETPFLHYYGDHSAPGLFLLALANDFAHTGNSEFFRSQLDHALAVLAWMDRDGDRDGDGFYEYSNLSGTLKNQGWKDSDQAILYEGGGLVRDPIALCEVQGLFYAAKSAMGACFIALGEQERGQKLLAEADALKRRFNERFWMEQEGFYALALDPEKKQVRTIADNPGACLAHGIVDDDKAAAVVQRLMAPDMFSGWGIRTLSATHPAFNPFAYHLGTVWPFANSLTAFGFWRYDFVPELHRLAGALFDASALFHLNRLPEAFGGHPRDARHPHPGIYANACAPQAWSAGCVTLLIRALLGITPLAPLNALVVDPVLPEWLPEVTISNLRIGQSRLELRFWREGDGRTEFEPIGPSGDIRVLRCSTRGGDRLGAALRLALRE